MQVIAPGKTPRGPSDRVKTDRKDAELLARLLLAGSLTRVVVPPPEVEAAREMTRAHDACRRDLMNARHRVSKMLLRHGRVYPKSTTWTAAHRRWLSAQQFAGPTVARLRAFRGIDTLTALSLHLELGADWKRFETAPALSAWLGLTPSLNQSGESSRQGSITKTGSMLARRLLVESAWHYSRQPRLGATLANRQAGQPDHILASQTAPSSDCTRSTAA
jgi:transposase